jgi:sulfite reductase (NADPH) flavoprotein alpha-component
MLEKTRQQSFDELISTSSVEELIWMNGFLSGTLFTQKKGIIQPNNSVQTKAQAVPVKLTILFGTETGNARNLAGKLSAIAKQEGAIAKVISLDQYRMSDLYKEHLLFIVISTQGDGEPPAAAQKFYNFIHTTDKELQQLRYGVIALGDSSYPLFCETGKEVDHKLNDLKGSRIQPVQLCDIDYEEAAQSWFRQALYILQRENTGTGILTKPANAATTAGVQKKQYTGTILRNVNLNDTGSEKQTHHIEIAAGPVAYEPGDSLAVVPPNSISTVNAILGLVNAEANSQMTFTYKGQEILLSELLQHSVNISHLPVRIVKRYAAIVGQQIPEVAISLINLLHIYPVQDLAQFSEVIQILDPITPRLYSIASSPAAHDGEVHVLVKRDEFSVEDEKRYGLCSDYLTGLPEGATISFYIHPNKMFRLPARETNDMIMIGAGTGVAPFRSFIAERAVQGASGCNWLFFGEQRFRTDFLYQTEWQSHQDSGVLTRINTAFSRDQKDKVYVQHKLKENGKEIYNWLENGASVYICGARQPMSADVEQALLDLIAEYGSKTTDEARAYLDRLEEADRYLKDVY